MSYDEIRSVLEAEMDEALKRHQAEEQDTDRTGALLARAIDRYRQFSDHGLIPDDFQEDGNLRF